MTLVPKGEYLQYGGQAIIEGVMMRSPKHFSVAVRAPNGEIICQTEPLAKTWIGRQKWLKLPFLRGSLALFDAMALGIRAMTFASNIQLDPKYEKKEEGAEVEEQVVAAEAEGMVQTDSPKSINNIAVGATMAVGLGVGLLLFVLLPNVVGEQLRHAGITNERMLNFASGLLKFVIFIGYVLLISRMPDVKRVFKYHGAEHKAINVLEAEQQLTMENCKAQTRLHPRCGTSFVIVVLIIDVLSLTFVPRYLVADVPYIVNLLVRFGLNLAVLPIIAGIAYELIRFAGKFRHSGLVNALFWPGLMTQYITTAEPDEDQIEVAITSLKACLVADEEAKVTDQTTMAS